MSDLAIERYKTYVKSVTDNWRKKIEGPAKRMLELDQLIEKLLAKKPLEKADDDQLAKYEAEYKKCREKIEKANKELELEMMVAPVIEKTKSNASELTKLPDIIKTIIKEKGVPISKNVVIAPDHIKFDFATMKLKSVGFKITWRF